MPATSELDITLFLKMSPFFTQASDATLSRLGAQARLRQISAGDCLFSKGDPGTAMYFVVDGKMRVHNGDVVITYLENGQVFGEVAALSSEARTASVSAELDSTLIELDQSSIYHTLSAQPDAARTVIEALCRRESEIIEEKFERLLSARLMENELQIGQKIQRNFLPQSLPELTGWDMAGLLQPARQVAGDFYDFFLLDQPRAVGVVIGDVCDKGVGAALFMTLFRSLIRSIAMHRSLTSTDPAANPADVLKQAIETTNRYIASTHGSSNMFASVFFGLLLPDSGELHYINAGHEAPLVIGERGIRTLLRTTGPVVGLFEEAPYEVAIEHLAAGEFLFAYTDGATDAKDRQENAFGEELVHALAAKGAADSHQLLQTLLQHMNLHIGEASQFDDITLICLHRNQA